MKAFFGIATACVFAFLGCSGGGKGTGSGSPADDNAADSAAPAAAVDSGVLVPPAVGFQLASTPITVAAGGEQYSCWSFVLPKTTTLNVVATEPQMSAHGVHHYAVFTKSGALPANPNGYDCKVMDATWGLVVGGGATTPGLTFPSGTAMTIPGGTQLVLQLHLLNATSAPENPTGVINLVGSNDSTLTQVGLLIAGTLDITIPPHESGVKVQGGCAAPFDMPNIFALFPHMHQLGTNIGITLTPTATKKTDTLIDKSWDFGNQGVYPATGSAKKGDQVQVTCTYDNTTDSTVTFGEDTENEMCLGVLFYWPLAPGGSGGLGGSNYCGI